MLRYSLVICGRGVAKRFASSFSGESALPPNLLLPTNLVDPDRLKRPPPPADCSLPVLRKCDAVIPAHLSPVQTWVETLESRDSEPLGLAHLHPDVFAVPPRLDILHSVEIWQKNFKRISHANTKVRSEVRGGGKKPWKQKGSGRARHGSIRSPIWRGGGVSHGPRGPTSYYYMLPMKVRVQGLKVALSSKMTQDYLHIVDSLNIPTPAQHRSVTMADMDESQFSLMCLEDELTCCICLGTFNCPVTIPCGHNFCQDCLLDSWQDSDYSCPQCRTVFPTKPELKKNTVLCSVVETFKSKSEVILTAEDNKAKKKDVIRCDTCMEAEASQTCLTCMASFCEEHLRPHRENPKFSVHQLIEPVGDLSEHICTDHHKLMEFFCSDHSQAICSLCLQQVHKGCSFMSPEEQRNLKESDLRDKLGLLDGKIERTETVMFQINDTQSKLKDAATKRKTAFAAVFQQMHDMLAQVECEAQHVVDCELETGQKKLCDFMKRLTENTENMRKAREDVNNLLSQSQTLAFLQASVDLPRAVKFDPYAPRINLDSKKVIATQAFAAALKEHLTEMFKQPVEARQVMLKPDEKADPVSGGAGSQPKSEQPDPQQQGQPMSHSSGFPSMQPFIQTVPVPVYIGGHGGWNPQYGRGQSAGPNRGPPFKGGQRPDKKSDGGQQHSHKQDKKPHSGPGGHQPSGKGSDSTKKDNPRSHPSGGKPNKNHPGPHKK